MTVVAFVTGIQSVDVDAAGIVAIEVPVAVFDTTASPSTLVGTGATQFFCDALTPDGDIRALARQAAQAYALGAFNTAVPIGNIRMPVLF